MIGTYTFYHYVGPYKMIDTLMYHIYCIKVVFIYQIIGTPEWVDWAGFGRY